MGEVTKKLAMLCGVTLCLVVFMGAGEPGCEPMDRPVDEPDDSGDPGDPDDPAYPPDDPGDPDPDSCEEMFERCIAEGDEGCEVILEGCLPVEPDPCESTYEECVLEGFPPEMCEEELWLCTEPWPVDPCDDAFFQCLEMGVDPFECELEYENCFEPMPCMDMFDRCVMSEPDPSVCDVILIYCEPWPADPCDEAFVECDMLAESCFMLEEIYFSCEGDPECEELGLEVEQCWDDVFECDDASWEICDDLMPEDPCDEAFAECGLLYETCFVLEEMYWMCEGDPECEELGLEVEQCWDEVFECDDAAWEICEDMFSHEDPCAPFFGECDVIIDECLELEEDEMLFCYETPEEPECEEYFERIDPCWLEAEACYDNAYELCTEHPGFDDEPIPYEG